MSDVDASVDDGSFELTEENRGIGAAASIVTFARSTGRNPASLSERHFNEYTAWVEQHPDDTELGLKVHFRGTFEKLLEHVTEVTDEEVKAYQSRVGL